MGDVYLFWDKLNDSPNILGEDGELYFYSEDSVAINQGAPDEECRHWVHTCKLGDNQPFNNPDRYLWCHPKTGEWIECDNMTPSDFREVYEAAGGLMDYEFR